MDNTYFDILKTLNNHGYLAYIVGGYVRDYILKRKTLDVDIITNATPKELKDIFPNVKCEFALYGALKLYVNDYIVDITTFRKELCYENGKPSKIVYINDLSEDLKRRDFTINTLCMDKNKNIIDLIGAKIDIDNKVIRTVKPFNISFLEDPSRIIRALRFMSVLDMKIENNAEEFIVKNKELIKKVSIYKKKEELNKLFGTRKVSKFIKFLKENDMEDVFGFKVNDFCETTSPLGVWAQLDIVEDYPFSKVEKEQIKKIKSLIKANKIDKMNIYKYGYYISKVAGEIIRINESVIYKMHDEIPIKEVKDICISSKRVCEILNIESSPFLGEVIKIIEKEIVLGNLINSKEEIEKFLKARF